MPAFGKATSVEIRRQNYNYKVKIVLTIIMKPESIDDNCLSDHGKEWITCGA